MLPEAIEHLYAVFARYRPRQPVKGCPCCTPEYEQERLNTIPLRELPPDLVESYLPNAMTTWGTEENFKYFLPRLLELFATDVPTLDDFFLRLKIAEDSGWPDWPGAEREAVLAYFQALWEKLLSFPDGYWQAGAVLGILVMLDADLQPYLAQLWQPATCRHLASLVNRCVWYDQDHGVMSIDDGGWRGLVPFLRAPRTLACLEDGYLSCANEDWAPEVADAADSLRAALEQEQY